MKHRYLIFCLLFQSFFFPAEAQQTATAFNGLPVSGGAGESEASTFLTMESVRYGMLAPLKGVQVTISNASCPGQPSYISLANPSGESWKYAVYSSAGQVCSEGETGYDRRIAIQEPGRYLVRFTHQSGTVAFDELTLRNPEAFTASIETDPALVYLVGQPVKLRALCPAATELTWEMGDGKTYQDVSSIEHTFQTPGEYRILLRANNWDCEATSEKIIAVGVAVAGMQPEH